jgi:hypothetical protein
MTAILATSGAIRSLVDGTLRLTVDIEPKDAQEAFALFGRPGSPVALARISNEAAVEHDRKSQAQPPAEPLERKPLSLASKVAITCAEKSFWAFLKADRKPGWNEAYGHLLATDPVARFDDSEIAAVLVRRICQVKSRSEITPGSAAERRWSDLEASYQHWQRWAA